MNCSFAPSKCWKSCLERGEPSCVSLVCRSAANATSALPRLPLRGDTRNLFAQNSRIMVFSILAAELELVLGEGSEMRASPADNSHRCDIDQRIPMATPQTCDHFLDLCRKSGVVDIAALDALLSVQPLPVDPKQVASLFIQLKLLTRFQASQLLLGKHRGFHFGGLKVLDQLGIGGMGAVYLCEQVKLRRRVAVKVLPTKQSQDEVARERFFREARAVAALDHPNIVRIHDCSTFNEIHYLLMEYVEGSDLQVKIDQQGKLPIDEAVGYVVQAASGLQHAHQRGLVHRDIKPSNLLVDKQGVLKILDMGLARFFQDPQDNLTQRLDGGAVVGTIDFLAPEQAVESSSVDSRADIYSLGATLYTLLSGKPPFDGSTTQKLIHHQVRTPPALNQIRAEVPPGLAEIVQKMMAKLPDDRYQSAQEVMDVLAPWVPAPTFCSSSTTTNAPKLPVKTQSSRYLRPPVIPTPVAE